MLRRFLLIVFLISLLPNSLDARQAISVGGLRFKSYNVPKDERTSLDLSAQEKFKVGDGLKLEFDLSINTRKDLGYIFRMHADASHSIDLICTPNYYADSLFVKLIYLGELMFEFHLDQSHLFRNQWHHVMIDLNVKEQFVSFVFNDSIQRKAFLSDDVWKEVGVVFGVSFEKPVKWTDTAEFILKDLKIRDNTDEVIHHWPLDQYGGNEAFDLIQNLKAIAVNPMWEVAKHQEWNHLITFKTEPYSGISWHPHSESIVNTISTGAYVYNVESNRLKFHSYTNSSPSFIDKHHLCWNPARNVLAAYSISGRGIGELDTQFWQWQNTFMMKDRLKGRYHHAAHVDDSGKLIFIAGYDWLEYQNGITIVDFENKTGYSKAYEGDVFYPRYLLGANYYSSHNGIYLFGGYGSIKGKQELGTQNFYDLHLYDNDAQQMKKVWQFNEIEESFVPVKNLIIDENDSIFYTLTYSNHEYKSSLRLCEFSLEKPDYRVVSDTIPYFFKDIESDANVFFNRKANEFIAYTKHLSNDSAVVNVYALKYPVVAESLSQVDVKRKFLITWYAVAFLVVLIAILVIVIIKRSKIIKTEEHIPDLSESKSIDTEEQVVAKINCILLFGDVKLIDSSGRNRIGHLSPKTFELFLVLLFKTYFDGGVTTNELTKLLWSHLEGLNAKNTRNVSISKLRKFLLDFDDVEINYMEGRYLLLLGDAFNVDFIDALNKIKALLNDPANTKHLDDLSNLIVNGSLLKGYDYPIADDAKDYLMNQVLDVFDCLISQDRLKQDHTLLLKLTEGVLVHDPLNEEAFLLKLYALNKAGRKSFAKNLYTNFVAEYQLAYKKTFPHTFHYCTTLSFDEIVSL